MPNWSSSIRVRASEATLFQWMLSTIVGYRPSATRLNTSSLFPRMMPPWGPGKVLCVDPIRREHPSLRGSWNSPPAIRPITWEPSYTQTASPAEEDISLTGCGNGMKLDPNIIRLGFSASDELLCLLDVDVHFVLAIGEVEVLHPEEPAKARLREPLVSAVIERDREDLVAALCEPVQNCHVGDVP